MHFEYTESNIQKLIKLLNLAHPTFRNRKHYQLFAFTATQTLCNASFLPEYIFFNNLITQELFLHITRNLNTAHVSGRALV